MNQTIFKNKKFNHKKLIEFGFVDDGEKYFYSKYILKNQFNLLITIFKSGKIDTQLIETDTKEPYTLHLIEGVKGAFVGQVKEEYDKILDSVCKNCFENNVFKSEYALKIIEYINKKYNDELEYLWEKLPSAAICRRKDNKKWYIIFMIIPKNKLGLKDNSPAEIINFKAQPDEVAALIDNKKYFHAYHMNKKYWLSVILDESLDLEEIFARIDNSYKLALK